MKILLLCNKSPWPLHEGGPIAMHAIISGLLKAGHEVKVLAANTNKYFVSPESIPAEFAEKTRIEFAYIDLSVRPLGALYNLLTGQSYHVTRFLNRDFEQKLIRILKEDSFDLIQCEMLYTTVYLDIIRKYSKAPVVLRAHNIEHLIWKRIAENSHNPLKKFYLKQLYLTLRAYELEILKKVNGIVAITAKDAGFFSEYAGKTPVISVPYGRDLAKGPDKPKTEHVIVPDLFHIGSMNWIPNAEGIQWFLSMVWPELHKEFPNLKLYLAGRMMPDWLLRSEYPNVVIDGEVPDASVYMQQHSVMIVPLFSGSGIRIKIIEAMENGKAVITTSIGAEGIQYKSGVDLMIADSKEAFIAAIRKLITETEFRQTICDNARELIRSKHDNALLIRDLEAFYKNIIQHDKLSGIQA